MRLEPFHCFFVLKSGDIFQFHKGAIRTQQFLVKYNYQYNFNSIKVRLERSEGGGKRQSDRNFNSIKVRLEQHTAHPQYFSIIYFNSIKVRLELNMSCRCYLQHLFQFHKGAIRTQSGLFCPHPLFLFQFHKGAIRTNAAPRLLCWISHFNSIKVRLERLEFCIIYSKPRIFQFHKGAIRTFNVSLIVAIIIISIP